MSIISKSTRNKYVQEVQREYKHLEDLWFSDIAEREHLKIAILIGADYLWGFQIGNSIRGELDEPVAVETEASYVLSGPLKGVQKEPVNVQLCIEEEGLNERLNKSWDVDEKPLASEKKIRYTNH